MPAKKSSKTKHTVSVPAEMKAAAIDKFGPPSVLSVRNVPVPRPGPKEVVIAVHAAGVGIWDAQMRDGNWIEGNPRFPIILGLDGAGTIVEVGDRARLFAIGDRVWAYEYDRPKGGFYAEYAVANVEHVGKLPAKLTMREGGAGAATGLTALQGCEDHLHLRRGEKVLIFGASGAVGSLAVQFAARYRRARVIAIASGAKAAKRLEALGAELVIDARKRNATDQIRGAALDGFDAILAFAGSPVLNAAMKCVKRGGRVAFPNGVEPPPRKRAGIRVIGYDAVASRAAFARLQHAVESAAFEVPIEAAFPLRQASKAHNRVERGHGFGRVVLDIR